jgi:hypothetical protein
MLDLANPQAATGGPVQKAPPGCRATLSMVSIIVPHIVSGAAFFARPARR